MYLGDAHLTITRNSKSSEQPWNRTSGAATRRLTGLIELIIELCGDLTGIPEIFRHLSSLKLLSLMDNEHE